MRKNPSGPDFFPPHSTLYKCTANGREGGRMLFHQATIRLKSRPRGYHLVTSEIVAALPGIARVRIGFLHLFLQHTSASLFLNENADPDVRRDFEHWTRKAIPDGADYLVH
jgi:secondary thiamine-phosphate synthase enzyme